jgi:predicted signal transduction protein with EAL and GGDEF domain
LVIDDNDQIHSDFRKTLMVAENPSASRLANAKAALFGAAQKPSPVRDVSFELETALQGREGVGLVKKAVEQGRPFNVAFVDMRMPPGWDGVQTIQRLWEADPNLEVVICTAYSDYSWEEISEKLGLDDKLLILKKPFDPIEVSQLAASLSTKWLAKKNANLKLEDLERLVTERTIDLLHEATHDRLTGLANRTLLRQRMIHAIELYKRNPQFKFAALFIDLDRFKLINDSLGHEVGDELLCTVGERLENALRSTDSVSPSLETPADEADAAKPFSAARLGGDEFIVVLEGLRDDGDALRVAQRLLEELQKPYELNGRVIHCSASIGITTSAVGYAKAEDMLRDADTAMYTAKAEGRARCALFDRKMHEQVAARLQLENELRQGVKRRQLFLQYQPIVSLETRKLLGFEALVRWNHPTRGVVYPGEFIEVCEETGLIEPLGYWVLEEACRQSAEWSGKYPQWKDLKISVNVSAKQLLLRDLVSKVKQIVDASGLSPSGVILEITESAMIRNPDVSIPVLNQLKALGVCLHMDDFGTGYSSMNCLHRLPLSGLKIDRSFIKSMTERRDFAAIVQSIAALARNLGIGLVAEGIETEEQVAMLQSMDCQAAQGFYFHSPMNADEAEKLLIESASQGGGAARSAA